MNDHLLSRVAQQIKKFLEEGLGSGYACSVLIASNGNAIFHKAFGWLDQERHKPASTDTPFWIASITKQFTAAAILKLSEQHKLSLDHRIDRYFAAVPNDKQQITLHQLLTHTAGFRQNYAADGITDRNAAVRSILEQPLKSTPGESFGYSNDAYNLLAAIVEIVSSESYESYLQRTLFQPAELAHTGFWGNPGHESVAAIHGDVPEQVQAPNWGFRGAVGIYSTTGDLYQWRQALEADRVLSISSRRKLMSPHIALGDNESVGYGWFISATPRKTTCVWTRGAEGFGHNAILLAYPEEKLLVIAASNAGERDGIAMSRQLAEGLANTIFSESA